MLSSSQDHDPFVLGAEIIILQGFSLEAETISVLTLFTELASRMLALFNNSFVRNFFLYEFLFIHPKVWKFDLF